jgi:hypothetical protein
MEIQQFITMMNSLTLTPEEKLQIIGQRQKACICLTCPTYVDCSVEEDDRAFCTIGKSACISEEKECLCPTCPVAASLGLKNRFYCTRGSENQQLLLEAMMVRREVV